GHGGGSERPVDEARASDVTGFRSCVAPASYGCGERSAPRLSRTATAGSLRPSRNSRNAPPAVDMYEMPSATPNLLIAAIVSPPPAIENASDSAIACASARVPSANASNSNTPIGPFHTIVPAFATIDLRAATL